MSIIAARQPNRHRPAPVREAVVLLCKKPVDCSLPQREITNIRPDTGCLSRLNDVGVRPSGSNCISNGRAIIQIPIEHFLLNAHR